jgi:hypothetical protein
MRGCRAHGVRTHSAATPSLFTLLLLVCRQAAAGGHTTKDLGHFSKTGTDLQEGTTAEGVTKPFTEQVVSYKHGDNVILHQWAGGGDLLVNCQSPTPQSFICQVRGHEHAL